jgi:hypothetical protein
MKTMILAAIAALSLSVGSAYAQSQYQPNTQSHSTHSVPAYSDDAPGGA